MKKFTSAIILAAGSSTRFGADTKKQYISLCGEPCLVHTVRAFEKSEYINEIIIVGDPQEINPILDGRGFTKIAKVVPGGATRQESALCGFDEISKKSKYVAIHDAARCLITPENIDAVVGTAFRNRSAAAAHRSEDTVKISGKYDFIDHTEDRDHVWLVQTPQVFKEDVYRVAAYMAKKDKAEVTDDCMMCERLGFEVKLVECGRDNIKLTRPVDLYIAEAILKSRGEEQ